MKKRIFVLFVLLISLFMVVGCDETAVDDHQKVINEINIVYEEGNNAGRVVDNLGLPTISSKVPEAVITWESSDEEVITIDGDVGLVTRPAEDTFVTLTLKVKIGEVTKTKTHTVKVLKLEEVIEPEVFTVTFDLGYDDSPEPTIVEVEEDGLVEEPETPEREGYEFIEWQLNGEEFTFDTPITADITLVAKWEEEIVIMYYYVSFVDEDLETIYEPIEVEAGTKVTKPEDPEKEGYTFVEWQLDGEAYDFDEEVNKDITLVAVWNELVDDQEELLFEDDFEHLASNIAYNTSPILVGGIDWTAKEVGYYSGDDNEPSKMLRFRGANTAYLYTSDFISNVTRFVFDAKYYNDGHKTAVMTVSYQLEGSDDWVLVKTIELGESLIENEIEINQDNVKLRIDVTKKSANIDNIKVYGVKGEVETYEVSFNPNNGDDVFVVEVEENRKVPTQSVPVKEGYVFKGWYLDLEDEEAFDFNVSITENIILIAKWEKITTITIAEAKTKEKYDHVEVIGTVTSLIGNNAFIQDDTGGIYLYLGSTVNKELVIGNEVKVSGKIDDYANTVQIKDDLIVELLAEDQEVPEAIVVEELDLDYLLEIQGQLVTIEGLTIKSIPSTLSGAYDVVLTDGTNDLTLRIDAYIDKHDEIKVLFEGAAIGQTLNVHNAPVWSFYGALQLMISLEEQLDFEAISDQDLIDLVEEYLVDKYDGKSYNMGTVIPSFEDELHGVQIVWDHNGNVEDDKWIEVEDDKNIIITATLSKGEATNEVAINLTIKYVDAEAYIVEDFENAELPSSYGDGSFVGVNGITFTFGHSRDEENFPIDGRGIMLRRASDSYLEFTLEDGLSYLAFQYRKAFTGVSARQLEVYINGVVVKTTETFGGTSEADDTIYDFTFTPDNPYSGIVTIKIKNVGTATTNKHITIDNIEWTTNP